MRSGRRQGAKLLGLAPSNDLEELLGNFSTRMPHSIIQQTASHPRGGQPPTRYIPRQTILLAVQDAAQCCLSRRARVEVVTLRHGPRSMRVSPSPQQPVATKPRMMLRRRPCHTLVAGRRRRAERGGRGGRRGPVPLAWASDQPESLSLLRT